MNMALKLTTTKTFINVNFKENVSSKVSSFKIIKRLLLNKFSFNCCLLSPFLDIVFGLLNKYKQLISIGGVACF
jgi:hypothetical protein